MADLPHEGLLFWLKAESILEEGGTSVSEWVPSLGGTCGYIVQPSAAEQPVFVEDGRNSQPYVYFSGKANMSLQKGVPLAAGATRTIFIQCSCEGDGMVLSNGSGASISVKGAWFSVQSEAGKPGCKLEGEVQTDLAPNAHHFLCLVASESGTQAFIDGRKATLGSNDSGGKQQLAHWDLTKGMFLGSSSGSFKGSIGEVLVYEGTLSVVDRKKVEGYLGKKFELGPDAEQRQRKAIASAEAASKKEKKKLAKQALIAKKSSTGSSSKNSKNSSSSSSSSSSSKSTLPSGSSPPKLTSKKVVKKSQSAASLPIFARPSTTPMGAARLQKSASSAILKPNHDLRTPTAPRIVFSKAERFRPHTAANAAASLGGELFFSFTPKAGTGRFSKDARFHDEESINTPGPGSIPSALRYDRGPKFGTSSRFGISKEAVSTPGPSFQVPAWRVSGTIKFSKGNRFGPVEDDPEGMSVYNPASFHTIGGQQKNQPKMKFGKSHRFDGDAKPSSFYSPGCNYYPSTFHYVPGSERRAHTPGGAVKFGSDKRFKDPPNAGVSAPSYTPPSFFTSNGKSVKFGSSKRFQDLAFQSKSPGPNYNPNGSTVAEKKAPIAVFSKSKRFELPKSQQDQDSAGTFYNPQTFTPISGKVDKNKTVKFGKSKRFGEIEEDLEGAIYEVATAVDKVKPKAGAPIIGKAPRFRMVRADNTLGPNFNPPLFGMLGDGKRSSNKTISWGPPPKKFVHVNDEPGASYLPSPAPIRGGKFSQSKRFT